MAKLTYASWNGEFTVDTRTDWEAWLEYLGVPKDAWQAAIKAPDFHKYKMTEAGFIMEHRIPGQNVHLHFYAALDGKWTKCPYPQPTATLWKEEAHNPAGGKPGQWRNKWLENPFCIQTELINFAGKGNTVRFTRKLQNAGASILFQVEVIDPGIEAIIAGPFSTVFKRISDDEPGEPPADSVSASFPTPAERYGNVPKGEGPAIDGQINCAIGSVLALGGLIGYAKKKSVPSLIGGLSCGLALLRSGVMAKSDPRGSSILGSIISALLTAAMLPRALKTQKMMPAGMVALIGFISLLHNASNLKKVS